MEPIDYGGALARGWRLLVVLGVLGLVAGLLVSHGASTGTQWATTSEVGIAPTAASTAAGGGIFGSPITTDEIIFAASADKVLALAAQQAHLDEPISSVKASVQFAAAPTDGSSSSTGSSGPPPGVVKITVRQGTAAQSAALNNALDFVLATSIAGAAQQAQQSAISQVQTAISQVQAQVKSLSPTNPTLAGALESQVTTLAAKEAAIIATPTDTGFVVLQSASAGDATEVGTSSITSSRPVRAVGGLVVGLVVGAVILFAVEAFDKRLRSAKRTERSFGFPVIAEIPDSSSPSAEAYRMLRLSLLFEPFPDVDGGDAELPGMPGDDADLWADAARPSAPPVPARRRSDGTRQVVLVVSPGSEPTRPFVAANLAAACAEAGQRVVVISTVDIAGTAFGSHLASGPISPHDVETHLEGSSVERVQRLSLEPFVANPGQVVTRAPAVLDALRGLVDVVIVEVPPFLSVHHGEGLAPTVDVVLAVAETNVTTSDEAARTGRLLRRLDAPVLGVVLTNVHVKDDRMARQEPDDVDVPDDDDEVTAPGAGTQSHTVSVMGLPGYDVPPGPSAGS